MDKISKKSLIIIFIFLIINILLRCWNLNNLPNSYDPYDEGVYLYSAKLIDAGQVPYKDFELGHPPLYIYFLSFLEKFNLSVAGMRVVNIILSSFVIIFIYLIARKVSQGYFIPIASLVFYTLSPSLFLYSRIVILEPVMTLFIIISLYFFLGDDNKRNKIISGSFLAIACFIKTTAIFAFVALLFIQTILKRKKFFKEEKYFIIAFLAVFLVIFFALLIIPNYFTDVISIQFIRSRLSWLARFGQLEMFFKLDFLLLGIGFLASLFLLFSKNNKIKTISFLNIFTFLVIFFVTKSFYAHYLIQLIPLLSIVLALAAEKMMKIKKLKYVNLFLLGVLVLQIFNIERLAISKNDYISQIVGQLKEEKGYLYTANPSFALSSGREITPWYYTAGSFSAFIKNVSSADLIEVMDRSSTILFDQRSGWQLPKEVQDYVFKNYEVKYKLGEYTIFEGRKL